MVTRTIMQTTAEVMTLEITKAEVQIRHYDIGGQYTNEVLLGMDEEDFIRYAKVLPPRTIKE